MQDFGDSVKKLLSQKSEPGETETKRAGVLALMAATVHNFIDVMLNEIERAGFVGIEYIEKASFFLRIITPSYEEEKFLQVLNTLEKVDARFPQTRFYTGLKTLRTIVAGKPEGYKHLAPTSYTAIEEMLHANPVELVFFTSYLLENLLRHISTLHTHYNNSRVVDIKQIRANIDSKFDEIVLNTVGHIGQAKTHQ
jgi:hypothetical protein